MSSCLLQSLWLTKIVKDQWTCTWKHCKPFAPRREAAASLLGSRFDELCAAALLFLRRFTTAASVYCDGARSPLLQDRCASDCNDFLCKGAKPGSVCTSTGIQGAVCMRHIFHKALKKKIILCLNKAVFKIFLFTQRHRDKWPKMLVVPMPGLVWCRKFI